MKMRGLGMFMGFAIALAASALCTSAVGCGSGTKVTSADVGAGVDAACNVIGAVAFKIDAGSFCTTWAEIAEAIAQDAGLAQPRPMASYTNQQIVDLVLKLRAKKAIAK